MGFSTDTAVTTDDDLFKYCFEQEIPNLLREAGKSDFSDVHKAAVNVLMRSLKRDGFDPSAITNTADFEEELCCWVLMTVFRGEALAGNAGAMRKYEVYRDCWMKSVEDRHIEDGSTEFETDGLPMVANADAGAYFGGMDNEGDQPWKQSLTNYENLVNDKES